MDIYIRRNDAFMICSRRLTVRMAFFQDADASSVLVGSTAGLKIVPITRNNFNGYIV